MAAKTFLKTTQAIFAVLFLLAQLTFAELPRYEFIDLGTLGGFYSCAYSINSSGQIVGMAANSSNCVRATLFDPTGSGNNIDLGTIGGCCGVARSINDRGQIVGWSSDSSTGWSKATLFDPTGNGDNVDLGSLGVGLSGAYSVNNNGHIVGYAFNSSSYSERATLFDPTGNGENIDLSTPDGSWSEVAYSINDKAQIVGKAQKSADYVCATLFDPNGSGNNIDLGTLGGSHSAAHSINDTGQIVGIAENSSGYDHATLFDPSGNADNTDLGILDVVSVSTTSLMKRNAQITHSPDSIDVIIVRPELPKYPATKAFCINDNGQIVGYYREALAPYKATLFDPTGNSNNLDLNTLLIDPNCGWTLEYAYSINNSGWIVGQGMNPAGEHHAYLLIPILPKIIYVDDDAAGANNGSSWPDAFNYLQDALAAANDGDEIRVAQGIYKPDQGAVVTTGDRTATFQLINGITLKGGYAGAGEPDPNAWDIEENRTILSGDLACNDIELNDPCDFRHDPSRDDNSYHVVTGSGTDETAVLDGFTITAGNADRADVDIRGAGLLNYPSGSPTLFHCTFRDNIAIFGGGVYNKDGSNPMLSYCTFYNNYADGHGGGIYNALSSSPTLMHCTFSANIAASGSGGAIGNFNFCSPALINCTFSGNYAAYSGGGMFNAFSSNSTLINCIFIGNVAGYGGGGGMRNRDSSPTLINCTFSGNHAEEYYRGGGLRNDQSSPSLRNCILWGNYDYSGGSEESVQICTDGGTPIVNYCCIQGWTGDLGGTGNFDADPYFVELGYWQDPCNTPYYPWDDVWIEGDYHLLPDSLCFDAGDPNYIAEPNETDLDGKPRVMGGRIDMGAYESPIFAEARILPQTINITSKGNWITCYIWLPDEYNVADIDPNSVLLEDLVPVASLSVNERHQVAIARFSRNDVQPILEVGDINLTITGRLTDGTVFDATDTIKVIEKTGKN